MYTSTFFFLNWLWLSSSREDVKTITFRACLCMSVEICCDHIIDEDDNAHTIHFFCSIFFSTILPLLLLLPPVYIASWTTHARLYTKL